MHMHEERQAVPLYVMVDMQPRWASAHAIVGMVEWVIEEAARTKSPVIVLEMKSEPGSPHSRTFKRLLDKMQSLGVIYITVTKTTPGGQSEIARVLKQTGWDHRVIKYFGVKTHQCVAHTVSRMREMFPHSRHQVLANACNDTNGNEWSRFPGGPNVEIINLKPEGAPHVRSGSKTASAERRNVHSGR